MKGKLAELVIEARGVSTKPKLFDAFESRETLPIYKVSTVSFVTWSLRRMKRCISHGMDVSFA